MLKELRHQLHQYPELSGEEKETARRIVEFISQYSPDQIDENVGGYGLLVSYNFSETGSTILIRCDLDALPIDEQTGLDYKSQIKGVSHKCGHDGHMSIVAGLASWLSDRPFQQGRVILLFQAAEETGKGAYEMLQDNRLKILNPDYIFALHNLPGFPLHSLVVADGQMTPSVMSLNVQLTGRVAHAAQPEKGINPTLAISTLNLAITNLANSNSDDPAYSMVTSIHTKIGTRDFGISPGEGEINFTLRAWNDEVLKTLRSQIEKVVKDTCLLHSLDYQINEADYFPSVVNHIECNTIIRSVARKNDIKILNQKRPLVFGEDFGYFTREYKASLFGLGAGENTLPLHHKDYDFNDDLIDTGKGVFIKIIEDILSD